MAKLRLCQKKIKTRFTTHVFLDREAAGPDIGLQWSGRIVMVGLPLYNVSRVGL